MLRCDPSLPHSFGEPCNVHAQSVCERAHHVGARHRFTAYVLAYLAFSQLHAEIGRRTYEVGLLHAGRIHRFMQTVSEFFLEHLTLLRVQFAIN